MSAALNTTQQKAPDATNAQGHNQNTSDSNSAHHRAAHKWQRPQRALLTGPHNSFELEKAPTFDHCPNSTVSELKKRHGLLIYTQMTRVAGYDGAGAIIAQYTLAAESRDKAEKLLGDA